MILGDYWFLIVANYLWCCRSPKDIFVMWGGFIGYLRGRVCVFGSQGGGCMLRSEMGCGEGDLKEGWSKIGGFCFSMD